MMTNKWRYYALLYSAQRVHYEPGNSGDWGSDPGKSKDMCLHSFRTVSGAHSTSSGTVPGLYRQGWSGKDDRLHSLQPYLYSPHVFKPRNSINPLNAELNPICHLLALLGVHHFLHVSRIRVKSLTRRQLMSYIYMTLVA